MPTWTITIYQPDTDKYLEFDMDSDNKPTDSEVIDQLEIFVGAEDDVRDQQKGTIMGARCTFVFKHSDTEAVALYSHWGEDHMYEELAAALQHARVRLGDASYYTRMAISYLIKDSILDETGYGIYPCNPTDLGFMDHPIVIDLVDKTINDDTGIHSIEDFVNYHGMATV